MKPISILFGLFLGLASAAWAGEPPNYVWHVVSSGAAACDLTRDPEANCVMEMHGQCVMTHVELPSPPAADWKMDLGWPILRPQTDLRGGIMAVSRKDLPSIMVNGAAIKLSKRTDCRYDGVLTVLYATENGVRLSCAVFPSVTLRAAMEQWTCENTGSSPLTLRVDSSQKVLAKPVDAMDRPSLVERRVEGLQGKRIGPGEKATWNVVYTLRQNSAAEVTADVAREKALRQGLFLKAQRTMALHTPDPLLDGTFAWAKMRLLEAPVESVKGLIQGTGTRSYLGGVWANDNVEYAAPACPYLADATLNLACNNMFGLWMHEPPSASISPSYESYRLCKIGNDRGDQAMMMYGLSSYLLALGDAGTAAKFWPLLEKAARLTKAATNSRGIVASRTDELEGRYPTGTANLSTSSLAYGGYRAAERLARSLGKTAEADDFQARAAALAQAIESYFGAEVEGYRTYRYFDGCRVLRGWISLPLAMGLLDRKEGTLAALFSPKLWFEDPPRDAGTKVASSDRGGGWPRETYYALRAAFKAGATELALQKTRSAVRSAMLGPAGPYMDEDGGDLLAPNVLYVSVITEGLFGIEPRSFDRFACAPRLPADWPSMRLQNICLMGRNVDLAVERTGAELTLTVSQSGKTVFRQRSADGTTIDVELSNVQR